jgi:hypothetical protein
MLDEAQALLGSWSLVCKSHEAGTSLIGLTETPVGRQTSWGRKTPAWAIAPGKSLRFRNVNCRKSSCL